MWRLIRDPPPMRQGPLPLRQSLIRVADDGRRGHLRLSLRMTCIYSHLFPGSRADLGFGRCEKGSGCCAIDHDPPGVDRALDSRRLGWAAAPAESCRIASASALRRSLAELRSSSCRHAFGLVRPCPTGLILRNQPGPPKFVATFFFEGVRSREGL